MNHIISRYAILTVQTSIINIVRYSHILFLYLIEYNFSMHCSNESFLCLSLKIKAYNSAILKSIIKNKVNIAITN